MTARAGVAPCAIAILTESSFFDDLPAALPAFR